MSEVKNVKISLYYAEWCGYCTRFMPIWKQFKEYINNSKKPILDTDGKQVTVTVKEYEADTKIAADRNAIDKVKNLIKGYPTILINDNKEYDGERTLASMLKHFNIPYSKPIEQKGGSNAYAKYKKYKSKYIALKNKK
jgi:thiol-disulfide isomerase/thioredoxin